MISPAISSSRNHSAPNGPRTGSQGLLLAVLAFAVCASCQRANDIPALMSAESPPEVSAAPKAGPAERPRSSLPPAVREVVDRLEEDFPDSAESLFARGEILQLFGQSDEAIWYWEQCLVHDPRDATALEQIALVHFNRGEFERAVERFNQVSQLDPDLPEARLHLGKALLNLGRFQDAIVVLEKQTELQPHAAEGWCRLGQAYQEAGEWERAQRCFFRAIDAFPDCTPAWSGLVRSSEELGQVDQAKKYRQRFHKLDETLTSSDRQHRRADDFSADRENRWLASTNAIAARVYTLHDEVEAARDLWKRAIELDDRNISYRQSLGQCLARKREYVDEALEVFSELHRLEPQNPDHLLALAFLHQKLKQLAAAERELEQAIQVAPQDVRAAIRLAQLYLSTGKQLPKAQRLTEQVVQIQPTAENFFLLSSLCRANDDHSGAQATLREAIRLDPQNPQYAAAAQALGQQ